MALAAISTCRLRLGATIIGAKASFKDQPVAEEKAGSKETSIAATHYGLLGLHPSTSVREIRQAYRDLSKLYHPDTTELPSAIAIRKFQHLNEAYATLSNPERRAAYDLSIGYSRVVVVRQLPSLHGNPKPEPKSSAYIDATDRPLSPGEIFALFILGITFVGCLILAITIGVTRGDQAFQPLSAQSVRVRQAESAQNAPTIPLNQATIESTESSSSYDPPSR